MTACRSGLQKQRAAAQKALWEAWQGWREGRWRHIGALVGRLGRRLGHWKRRVSVVGDVQGSSSGRLHAQEPLSHLLRAAYMPLGDRPVRHRWEHGDSAWMATCSG